MHLFKNTSAKHFTFIGLVVSALFFSGSCKKMRKAEVAIVMAKINEDGSVQLNAKITDGSKHAKRVGFCYSDSPNPEEFGIDVVNGEEGTNYCDLKLNFDVTLQGSRFKSYKDYYFRPFVVTLKNETYYGDEIHYANIQKAFLTPPCMITDNQINIGTGDPAEYFTSAHMNSNYVISAQSPGYNFTYTFTEKPRTGIYTADPVPSSGEVRISFTSSATSGYFTEGSKVYVNEIAKDKYEISFCNASWKAPSTVISHASGKVIVD